MGYYEDQKKLTEHAAMKDIFQAKAAEDAINKSFQSGMLNGAVETAERMAQEYGAIQTSGSA
jgi:hypothetical protein